MNLITYGANNMKALFEEIVAGIYDFFNPELEGYVNFDFGGGNLVNIHVIVFGIFIGVFVASFYMVYVKNFVGAFVRKLLAEGCLSAETGKTLAELGFAKNIFVKLALRGTLLTGTVSRAETCEAAKEKSKTLESGGENDSPTENDILAKDSETKDGEPEKGSGESPRNEQTKSVAKHADTASTRYYVKEEKKYVAEMRFNARGSGWPTLLFVLLISILCVIAIFAFLPQILRFLDNTISIFSVKGNTIK